MLNINKMMFHIIMLIFKRKRKRLIAPVGYKNCGFLRLKSRSVFKAKNVGNLCSFSVMFLNAHGMNQQVTGEGDTQPPNALSSSAATARVR